MKRLRNVMKWRQEMEIQKGKKYKITVSIGNKILYFTGGVLSNENNFITFKDKFGKILNYNLNSILSFEEVKNG